jgi:crossover junction endodeoxyribonuclease RusA
MNAIRLNVLGLAQPKGSTRAFVKKRRDGQMFAATTSDNPKLKDWQQRIATEAQRVRAGRFASAGVPVAVAATFCLLRPASISAKKRPYPTVAPDVDKLTRALLDAMTGVLYADDAQVVSVQTYKVYADHGKPPGVNVKVWM